MDRTCLIHGTSVGRIGLGWVGYLGNVPAGQGSCVGDVGRWTHSLTYSHLFVPVTLVAGMYVAVHPAKLDG